MDYRQKLPSQWKISLISVRERLPKGQETSGEVSSTAMDEVLAYLYSLGHDTLTGMSVKIYQKLLSWTLVFFRPAQHCDKPSASKVIGALA